MAELDVTKETMLTFSLRVTWMDIIRNVSIRGIVDDVKKIPERPGK